MYCIRSVPFNCNYSSILHILNNSNVCIRTKHDKVSRLRRIAFGCVMETSSFGIVPVIRSNSCSFWNNTGINQSCFVCTPGHEARTPRSYITINKLASHNISPVLCSTWIIFFLQSDLYDSFSTSCYHRSRRH